MPLTTAATGIGKQVVTHAARTWLGARQERAERDAELIDLVRISVRDHFQRRKLIRQLEELADQIAERLRPVYEHDFRTVPENERVAALLAVVDALQAADLTDDTLFAVDVNPRRLAGLVRERVPVRRVGLAEPAERLDKHANRLRDLGVLTELPDLGRLTIEGAPLAGGLAAMAPVLDQLKGLSVWSVPTVTSLDALAGSTLDYLNLVNCPIIDLEPLGTLQSLTHVRLGRLPGLNLAPLASLPHLRELMLVDMNEPVDLITARPDGPSYAGRAAEYAHRGGTGSPGQGPAPLTQRRAARDADHTDHVSS